MEHDISEFEKLKNEIETLNIPGLQAWAAEPPKAELLPWIADLQNEQFTWMETHAADFAKHAERCAVQAEEAKEHLASISPSPAIDELKRLQLHLDCVFESYKMSNLLAVIPTEPAFRKLREASANIPIHPAEKAFAWELEEHEGEIISSRSTAKYMFSQASEAFKQAVDELNARKILMQQAFQRCQKAWNSKELQGISKRRARMCVESRQVERERIISEFGKLKCEIEAKNIKGLRAFSANPPKTELVPWIVDLQKKQFTWMETHAADFAKHAERCAAQAEEAKVHLEGVSASSGIEELKKLRLHLDCVFESYKMSHLLATIPTQRAFDKLREGSAIPIHPEETNFAWELEEHEDERMSSRSTAKYMFSPASKASKYSVKDLELRKDVMQQAFQRCQKAWNSKELQGICKRRARTCVESRQVERERIVSAFRKLKDEIEAKNIKGLRAFSANPPKSEPLPWIVDLQNKQFTWMETHAADFAKHAERCAAQAEEAKVHLTGVSASSGIEELKKVQLHLDCVFESYKMSHLLAVIPTRRAFDKLRDGSANLPIDLVENEFAWELEEHDDGIMSSSRSVTNYMFSQASEAFKQAVDELKARKILMQQAFKRCHQAWNSKEVQGIYTRRARMCEFGKLKYEIGTQNIPALKAWAAERPKSEPVPWSVDLQNEQFTWMETHAADFEKHAERCAAQAEEAEVLLKGISASSGIEKLKKVELHLECVAESYKMADFLAAVPTKRAFDKLREGSAIPIHPAETNFAWELEEHEESGIISSRSAANHIFSRASEAFKYSVKDLESRKISMQQAFQRFQKAWNSKELQGICKRRARMCVESRQVERERIVSEFRKLKYEIEAKNIKGLRAFSADPPKTELVPWIVDLQNKQFTWMETHAADFAKHAERCAAQAEEAKVHLTGVSASSGIEELKKVQLHLDCVFESYKMSGLLAVIPTKRAFDKLHDGSANLRIQPAENNFNWELEEHDDGIMSSRSVTKYMFSQASEAFKQSVDELKERKILMQQAFKRCHQAWFSKELQGIYTRRARMCEFGKLKYEIGTQNIPALKAWAAERPKSEPVPWSVDLQNEQFTWMETHAADFEKHAERCAAQAEEAKVHLNGISASSGIEELKKVELHLECVAESYKMADFLAAVPTKRAFRKLREGSAIPIHPAETNFAWELEEHEESGIISSRSAANHIFSRASEAFKYSVKDLESRKISMQQAFQRFQKAWNSKELQGIFKRRARMCVESRQVERDRIILEFRKLKYEIEAKNIKGLRAFSADPPKTKLVPWIADLQKRNFMWMETHAADFAKPAERCAAQAEEAKVHLKGISASSGIDELKRLQLHLDCVFESYKMANLLAVIPTEPAFHKLREGSANLPIHTAETNFNWELKEYEGDGIISSRSAAHFIFSPASEAFKYSVKDLESRKISMQQAFQRFENAWNSKELQGIFKRRARMCEFGKLKYEIETQNIPALKALAAGRPNSEPLPWIVDLQNKQFTWMETHAADYAKHAERCAAQAEEAKVHLNGISASSGIEELKKVGLHLECVAESYKMADFLAAVPTKRAFRKLTSHLLDGSTIAIQPVESDFILELEQCEERKISSRSAANYVFKQASEAFECTAGDLETRKVLMQEAFQRCFKAWHSKELQDLCKLRARRYFESSQVERERNIAEFGRLRDQIEAHIFSLLRAYAAERPKREPVPWIVDLQNEQFDWMETHAAHFEKHAERCAAQAEEAKVHLNGISASSGIEELKKVELHLECVSESYKMSDFLAEIPTKQAFRKLTSYLLGGSTVAIQPIESDFILELEQCDDGKVSFRSAANYVFKQASEALECTVGELETRKVLMQEAFQRCFQAWYSLELQNICANRARRVSQSRDRAVGDSGRPAAKS